MFSREVFIWNGGSLVSGDYVTIRTPQGGEVTGKVVMSFSTHVVINIGGKYGTPKIADHSNILTAVRKGGK